MRINGVVGVNPTHIHAGTCDDLDPNTKYPLTNIELNTTELVGTSDSVVDVPLDELLASPHLILIHKSPEDLKTYYACGNIVADTTGANVTENSGVGAGTTDEAGLAAARLRGPRRLPALRRSLPRRLPHLAAMQCASVVFASSFTLSWNNPGSRARGQLSTGGGEPYG